MKPLVSIKGNINHNSCMRLWLYVLINVAEEALFPITKKTSNFKAREILSARDWIMSDSKLFNSFVSLCDLCGIRPEKLRRKVDLLMKSEEDNKREATDGIKKDQCTDSKGVEQRYSSMDDAIQRGAQREAGFSEVDVL